MKAQKRSRHGLNAAMVRLKLKGLNAIDRRTITGRSLIAWRDELLAALGGPGNVSPQKTALVDLAARTRALIDHADAFLLGEPSILNRRKKAFLPIVAQRQSLCDSLARLLGQLGLERVPRAIKPLAEYIRDHDSRQKPQRDEEEPPEIDRNKEPEEATA